MPSGLWTLAATLARCSGGRLLLVWFGLGVLGQAQAALTILTQPQSQSALVGSSVTFSVSATNDTSYSYEPNGRGSQTNVIYTGRSAGAIACTFDFNGVGDRMTIYYDSVQIFDTGTVSGKGGFNLSYGLGTNTSVTVIMNEGDNYPPSTWGYRMSLLAPLYYQWRKDAANIADATNAFYALASVQTNQAGNYSVLVSDSAGSLPSSPAVLTVSGVAAYVNGQLIATTQYAFAGSVSVQLQTGYAGGSIYYTLDGTEPTLTSPHYVGTLTLTTNASLRAIAYSADFSQISLGVPIAFTKVSGFALTAVTAGGGSIALNPPNGIYISNTIVNLSVTTNAGWTFLGWLGDASGTSPMTSVTMDQNRQVEAVFGTGFNAVANTNGTILLAPVSSLYPFGTVLRVTATPLAGKYFGAWGDATVGNANPLDLLVTNANQTISAGFPPVSAGQAALTVGVTGFGRVTVNPQANVYNLGTNVTLIATPESGQTFLGWTNDASGTSNPLVVTMTTNKIIAANFTKRSVLADTPPLGGPTVRGLQLTLAGELGGRFQLEAATNLTTWAALTVLTNRLGRMQYIDPSGTNTPARFYRALQLP